MNKTYRSIWNEALGAWVAVSEIENAKGKPAGSAESVKPRITFGTFALRAVLAALLGVPGFYSPSAFADGTLNCTFGGAGTTAPSSAVHSIKCGHGTSASNGYSVAIGPNANAGADKAVALGEGTVVQGKQSVAVGSQSQALGEQSVALGNDTRATGKSSVAIGGDDLDAVATSNQTVITGYNTAHANATANNTELARKYFTLTGDYLVNFNEPSKRYIATKSEDGGVAVGVSATSAGLATSFGTRATASGVSSLALGVGSTAEKEGAVAIGAGSTTKNIAGEGITATALNAGKQPVGASETAAYYRLNLNGVDFDFKAGNSVSAGDIVSFGSPGFERQLKNVAPGKVSENSTDAINGSQLYTVVDALTALKGNVGTLETKQTRFYSIGQGLSSEGNYNNDGATGGKSLAAGIGASATHLKTTAVGTNAAATQDASLALGNDTAASGRASTAIGDHAKAAGNQAVAIGQHAQGNAQWDISIGRNAGANRAASVTSNGRNVAIGDGALKYGDALNNNIAMGTDTGMGLTGNSNVMLGTYVNSAEAIKSAVDTGGLTENDIGVKEVTSTDPVSTNQVTVKAVASTNNSVAIGTRALTSGMGQVAVGQQAKAIGTTSIAVGNSSRSSGLSALSVGNSATAKGNSTIAVGMQANAEGGSAVAIGANTISTGVNSLALGVSARAQGQGSVAIGQQANLAAQAGTNSVAVGVRTSSQAIHSVAIGTEATVSALTVSDGQVADRLGNRYAASLVGSALNGQGSVAIGSSSDAQGTNAVAIGQMAEALGQNTLAAGNDSHAIGKSSVAFGDGARTENDSALAAGYAAKATGANSAALGASSQATAAGALALGQNARAEVAEGVALGTGSVASVDKGQVGADPLNAVDSKTGSAWTSTKAAVSVGNGATDTRQITGLAAGTADTDAVNVAQLKAAGFKLAAAHTGGGESSTVADDKIQNGETVTFDAGKNIKITHTANNIAVATKDNVEFTTMAAQDAQGNRTEINGSGITVTPVGGGNPVSLTSDGLNNGGKVISNVANGNVAQGSQEAVTGDQLYSLQQQLNDSVGNAGKGLNFTGNGGNFNRKLGETVTVKGGLDNAVAASSANIRTVADSTGNIEILLADAPTFAGKVSAQGLDAGNQKITGVLKGDQPADAVNVSQLREAIQNVAVTTQSVINANSPFSYVNSQGEMLTRSVENGKVKFTKSSDGSEYKESDISIAALNAVDPQSTIPTTLNNIQAGAKDNDAVNVNQLKNTLKALGGGAAVNSNGTIKDPVYSINTAAGGNQTFNNVGDALAALNADTVKPLTFSGDNDTVKVARKLGEELAVKGGAQGTLTEGNIGVEGNADDHTLTIKLAEKVDLGENGSLKTGATTVNNSGVKVEAAGKQPVSLTSDGLNNGGNTIANVGAGKNGTDAVNVSQLTPLAAALGVNVDPNSGTVSAPEWNVTKADGTQYAGVNTIQAALDNIGTEIQKPITFAGNSGNTAKKLGETFTVKGALADDAAASAQNLRTTVGSDGQMLIELAESPRFGNITVNDNGKISGVEAGVDAKDAVNKGQLDEVKAVADVKTKVHAGTGVAVENKGSEAAPDYEVALNDASKQSLAKADSALQSITSASPNLTVGGKQADGSIELNFSSTPKFAEVTAGKTTVGSVVTDGTSGKISGLNNGTVAAGSKEAVNGGQLFAQGEGVKNIIGGNTVYNPDTGAFENADIGGTGKGNVNDAIAAVKATADAGWTLSAQGENGGKVGAGETVDLRNTDNNIVVAKKDSEDTVTFDLARAISVDKITAGGNVLDSDGLTVGGKNYVGANGLNANNQTIANVGAGKDGTDAVNVSQLTPLAAALGVAVDPNSGTVSAPVWNVTKADGTQYAGVNTIQGALDNIGAEIQKPISFAGNSGNTAKKLGETFTVKGALADDAAASAQNLRTKVGSDGQMLIELAESPRFGNITVNDNGKISGVEAGVDAKDAVNKGQLDAVQSVAAVKTKVHAGTGVAVENKGSEAAPDYEVALNDASKQSLAKADSAVQSITSASPNLTVGEKKADGSIELNFSNTPEFAEVTAGKTTVGSVVTDGASGKISGLSDGLVAAGSKEAVNGGQLFAQGEGVKNIIGGNTVYKPDTGAFENTDIGGTGKGNVSDAIAAVKATADAGWTLTAQGENGGKVAAGDTVDLRNADGNIKVAKSADADTVTFDLAKEISLDKVTAGGNVLASDGLTVGGKNYVGANGLNANNQTIANVGAGKNGTDAVNVSQLTPLATALGVNVDPNSGTVSAPVWNVTKADGSKYDGVNTIQGALDNIGTEIQKPITFAGNSGNTAKKLGETFTVKGALADNAAASAQNLRTKVENGEMLIELAESPRFGNITVNDNGKISGLNNGTVAAGSKEAVNGGQLFAQGEGVKNIIGGNTVYKPDTGAFENTDIGGTGKGNVSDAIAAVKATADAGWTLSAQGENGGKVGAGETVDLRNTDGNIKVAKAADADTVTFDLAKALNIDSVTAGNTVLNQDGVKVGDKVALTSDGLKAGDVNIGTNGIDAGNKVIGNVKAGEKDGDAVNVAQLKEAAAASANKVKAGSNIEVGETKNADGSTTYTVATAKDLTVDSVTAGNTLLNNAGVKVGDKVALSSDGLKAGDVNIGTNGIDAGNKVIGNVKAGEKDGDAVNVAQLKEAAAASANKVKAGGNIEVGETKNADGSTTYTVATAKDLTVDSVKAGNTLLNNAGVKVGDNVALTSDGLKAGDVNITAAGIDAGNKVIGNVKAGEKDGDAVNVAQLKEVAAASANKVAEGDNIEVAEEKQADGSTTYTVKTKRDVGFDSVTSGTVTAGAGSNRVVLDNNGVSVGGNTYISDSGLNANNRRIANVDNGRIAEGSQDAVNGGQLYGHAASVANIFGGNAAVNPDGSVSMSNVGGTGAGNVNDAIQIAHRAAQAANQAAVVAKTTVTAGNNVVVEQSTNADGSSNYTVATAKDLTVDSVKAGDTVVNNAGVNVGGNVALTSDGLKAGNVTVNAAGINAAGNKITNVADGDINAASTDAVNGRQIYALLGGSGSAMNTTTAPATQSADGSTTPAGTVVTTVTHPDGTTTTTTETNQTVAVSTDKAGKQYTLKTYNVEGQNTYLTNDVVQAVGKMNEQGIKFFHTNDGEVKPVVQGHNNEDSSASGAYATAIGYQSAAAGTGAVAMGNTYTAAEKADGAQVSEVKDAQGNVTGYEQRTLASGERSIAMGTGSQALAADSIAIGTGNVVTGKGSGAIGDPTVVTGDSSYSVGNNNTVSADNAYALGSNIKATLANSVYLGDNASATAVHTTAAGGHYTFAGANDANVAGVNDVVGVVSVGTEGQTRQIQNVAAGVVSPTSTDAINGSQLHYTNQAINNVANYTVNMGNQLNQRIDDVENRSNAGAATAMAVAGLPQAYLPGKSMVAVAGGVYRGESGYAVGYSSISDGGNWIIKGSATGNSRGHYGATAGVGYQW